jgi:anti-anti-sigma factor
MAVAPERPVGQSFGRGDARIAVCVDGALTRGYAAVVALRGEHDISTSEAVRVALAPLCGRVLVDLSACDFIDSTIISVLLKKTGELSREGDELELLVTADSIVSRALAIIGVQGLVAVRDAL